MRLALAFTSTDEPALDFSGVTLSPQNHLRDRDRRFFHSRRRSHCEVAQGEGK